jgi:hypothetical protein
VYPPQRPGDFFLTTRVTEQRYALPDNCTYPPLTNDCLVQPVGPANASYIADIEDFTVLISHAVYGMETAVTESNICMDGSMPYGDPTLAPNGYTNVARWFRSNDTLICPGETPWSASDYETGSDVPWTDRGALPGDVITVKQLMEAAAITDLDERSYVINSTDSIRYDGAIVVVFISYSNSASSSSRLNYEYYTHRIPRISYKVEETIHTNFSQEYVVRDRHGIQLVFLQIGSIGVFSFQVLLATIVG